MDDVGSPYARAMRPALVTALTDTPVVALLGPRQCGTSTPAQTFAPEFTSISLDDEAVLATARHDPARLVAGLPHRTIIDEVQRAPRMLRAIKLVVDRDRQSGKLLLTASANRLLLPQLGDSLAGRMEIVALEPLTEAGKVRDVQDAARVKDVSEVARLLEILASRTGEWLNVSKVSRDLGLQRDTGDKHLTIFERLFLVRRMPAWHRNEAKRLVKAPKIHRVDSGLAARLSGLTVGDWALRRDRFGHLLESFVVQQVIAQAGWTNPDLLFWHYRDKDQEEVDRVITLGRKTWGVEVKSSASVNESDGRGLRRLAEQCGKDFQGGMLAYTGANVLPMADKRMWAVPIRDFWVG